MREVLPLRVDFVKWREVRLTSSTVAKGGGIVESLFFRHLPLQESSLFASQSSENLLLTHHHFSNKLDQSSYATRH